MVSGDFIPYAILPDELVSVSQSATINGIITATVAVRALGTKLSRLTPWYWVALAAYTSGITDVIGGIYGFMDKVTARLFFRYRICIDWFHDRLIFLGFPFQLEQNASHGQSPRNRSQVAAAKATANYSVTTCIKSSLVLGFGLTAFDELFKIATLCLGCLVVSLAFVLLSR